MNYWIFVATDHPEHNITSKQVYEQRMNDKFWGLGERTPNRNSLKRGDKVLFYLGSSEKLFAGSATLESDGFALTPQQRESFSHGHAFFTTDYGVKLTDVLIFPNPKFVSDLIPKLDFIENKEYWGSYFQGGVRKITLRDYTLISESTEIGKKEDISQAPKTESESEFALESHLEEFLFVNWNQIDFFKEKLSLYSVEDINGRQFPAGDWSIDFLCTDITNGDFVVIELKRGKPSDSVVGQTLRYVTWVRENLARENQRVKGIIIAREIDKPLQYAIRSVPDIKVLTYKVDFKLLLANE
jgi:hypothetical protein